MNNSRQIVIRIRIIISDCFSISIYSYCLCSWKKTFYVIIGITDLIPLCILECRHQISGHIPCIMNRISSCICHWFHMILIWCHNSGNPGTRLRNFRINTSAFQDIARWIIGKTIYHILCRCPLNYITCCFFIVILILERITFRICDTCHIRLTVILKLRYLFLQIFNWNEVIFIIISITASKIFFI